MLLLTGCGKHSAIPDKDTNVQLGSYIFFDAGLAETKGTLFSGNTLPGDPGTSFSVFGFRADNTTPIFTNHPGGVATVFRPEDSSASTPKPFTYDNLELWHSGTHSFYAYYTHESIPNSVISQIGSDASGHYLVYAQPTQLSGMTDLMTACTTATSADGEVELVFNHRLSALDLVVRNMHTTNDMQPDVNAGKFRVTELVINLNVSKTANMYFTDSDKNGVVDVTLSSEQVSISYSRPQFDISAPEQGKTYRDYSVCSSSGNFFLFAPCASLNVQLTLKYINVWNEQCEFSLDQEIKLQNGSFLPGYKYVFIVTKKSVGNEVEFETSLVTDYENNGNRLDIDIEYN